MLVQVYKIGIMVQMGRGSSMESPSKGPWLMLSKYLEPFLTSPQLRGFLNLGRLLSPPAYMYDVIPAMRLYTECVKTVT
jgi:hypothetical protein